MTAPGALMVEVQRWLEGLYEIPPQAPVTDFVLEPDFRGYHLAPGLGPEQEERYHARPSPDLSARRGRRRAGGAGGA